MASSEDLLRKLRNLLLPREGRSRDAYGEVDPVAQAAQGRASLALSLLTYPELFYELQAQAATSLSLELSSFLDRIQAAVESLGLAYRPEPPVFQRSTLTPLRGILDRLSVEDLAKNPTYLQWRAESERLLRQELSGSVHLGQVVAPPKQARKVSADIAIELEGRLASLESSASLLAAALGTFAAAPLTRFPLKQLADRLRREVAVLQERANADTSEEVAVTLLAARAALKGLESRRQLRSPLRATGTVSAVPHSEAYPSTPPYVETLPAPYLFESTRTLRVQVGASTENLLVEAALYPTVFSFLPETYLWQPSYALGSDPYVLPAPRSLQLYGEKEGVRYDLSLAVPGGTYTKASLASTLNALWTAQGREGVVQLTPTGSLQGVGGAVLAVGDGEINSIIGLSSTGGIPVTAAATVAKPFVVGPYTFATTSSLLLQCRTPAQGQVQVEVVISAGSYTATDLRNLIQARFDALGLADISAVATFGVLALVIASDREASVSILACSALGPLGETGPSTLSGQIEQRELQLQLNDSPLTVTVDARDYSATSLAAALAAHLGVSYLVIASGLPGSRTLSISYRGPGALTAKLRALPSRLATRLKLAQGVFEASPFTASQLAARLQSQTRLLRCTSVPHEPVSLFAQTVPGLPSDLLLYDAQGEASLTSPAAGIIELTATRAWTLSVGDKVALLRDGLPTSLWTVTDIAGLVLRASGTGSPPAEPVSWAGGRPLAIVAGSVVRIEGGPLAGDHQAVSLNGLVVRTRTSFPFQGSSPALLGRQKVRLEALAPADLSLTNGDFSDLFGSFPITRSPTTPWIKFSSAVPGLAVGDELVANVVYRIEEIEDLHVRLEAEVPSSFNVTLGSGTYVSCTKFLQHSAAEKELRVWIENASIRKDQLQQAIRAVFSAVGRANPLPGQVRRAQLELDLLRQQLLTLAPLLGAFQTGVTVLAEEAVTDLERRGLGRAVDLLLTCDFATLFSEDASLDRYDQVFQSLRAEALTRSRDMTDQEDESRTQIDYVNEEEEFAAEDEDALE